MSHGFDAWALTLVTFIPLVGVILLMVIPKAEEELLKLAALGASIATALVLGFGVIRNYSIHREGLQFEVNLAPWDLAAGAAILEAAGGQLTGGRGEPFDICGPRVVATNGLIHSAVEEIA